MTSNDFYNNGTNEQKEAYKDIVDRFKKQDDPRLAVIADRYTEAAVSQPFPMGKDTDGNEVWGVYVEYKRGGGILLGIEPDGHTHS